LSIPLQKHCHTHGISDAVVPTITRHISQNLHHIVKLADGKIGALSAKNLKTEPILIEYATVFQPLKPT
ncbi:hypothetical protein OFN40_29020, partial [Escherichia coli]|nr:hypothetical protein [Escherichia coli]